MTGSIFVRLLGRLVLSPGKIPALLKFQQQTVARRPRALAEVLHRSIGSATKLKPRRVKAVRFSVPLFFRCR